jgi:hypothetical protein
MANADDIARTIEPGSLEQGDRNKIRGQLMEAFQSNGTNPVGAGAAAQSGAGNPLDALMGGQHSSDLPVTDGLSVGPGRGPAETTTTQSPLIEKLRALAVGANSPVLKQLARQALRAELARGN